MTLLLFSICCAGTDAQNLAVNPSCEDVAAGQALPRGWALSPITRRCAVKVSDGEAHSGKRALFAAADPYADGKRFETQGLFRVDVDLSRYEAIPGEFYTLSAWYRLSGRATISLQASVVGPPGFNAEDGGNIRVMGVSGETPKEWNLAQTTIVLPKGTQRFFGIQIHGYMRAPGEKIWVDDVRLEPARALAVPLTTDPPSLDGKLGEEAWKSAPAFRFVTNSDKPEPPEQATTGYVLRDARNFYLGFRCEETTLGSVDFVPADRDASQVWQLDRMEFFFAPKRGKDHIVHQFITNLAGSRYDERDKNREWNPAWEVKTGQGEKEWTIEARIPISELGYEVWPEFEQIRFNAVRGRKQKNNPHTFSAWSPPGAIFKAARKMGLLIIGDPLEYMRRRGLLKLKVHTNRLTYRKHDRRLFGWVEMPIWNSAVQKYRFRFEIRKDGKTFSSQTLKQKPEGFRIEEQISRLSPGRYEAIIDVRNQNNEEMGGGQASFTIAESYEKRPRWPKQQRIPMRMTRPSPVSLERWHFTTGVPLPRGLLYGRGNYDLPKVKARLVNSEGKDIPAAISAINEWAPWSSDGPYGRSVRWLRVEFQDRVTKGAANEYALQIWKKERATARVVRINEGTDQIVVDAGRLVFSVRKKGFNFLNGLSVDGEQVIAPASDAAPYMIDHTGTRYSGALDPEVNVRVEYQTPLRAVIRAEGRHLSKEGKPLSRFILRITAFSELPYLTVSHTFVLTEDTHKVRYRDIALPIPTAKGDAVIGGDGDRQITLKPGSHLLQQTWEKFLVHDEAGNQISAGEKAAGWVVQGNMGVAVRDIWQNYPKEIELTGDPSRLIVHFWPAHGIDNPNRKITVDDLSYLWFCHEGRELDFSIGPKYRTEEIAKQAYSKFCFKAAMESNAAGVAKTHDVLLVFDAKGVTPNQMKSYNAMFQSDTHVLSDPKWNCESGVFGRMHPYDPGRFKPVEDLVSRAFDSFQRVRDHFNDYGMWSWGDTHTGYMRRNWNIYRIMKGTHQGRPREYLYQYVRTGNPKYLDWARRNHRHIADVDTAHLDLNLPGVVKRKGGIGYPGLTHWIGEGYFGFYIMQDFMWNLYLLTGDHRMLDVIHEQADYLRNHRGGSEGRGGAGALATTLKFFTETQELSMLPSVYAQRESMLRKPGHKQQAATWAPWLRRLVDDLGDREAVEFAKEWAASGRVGILGIPAGPDILAYAALESGDGELLRRARGKLEVWTDTQYLNEKKLYHGDNGFHDYARYFAQEFSYLLYALAKVPSRNKPIFDSQGFGVITGQVDNRREFNVFLKPGRNRDEGIKMTWRAGGHAEFNMVVTDSRGKEVYRRPLKLGTEDDMPSHTLPPIKDSHYRIRIDGPNKNFLFRFLKPTPQHTKMVVHCHPAIGIYLGFGRWFLKPKPGAKKMTLHLYQTWGFDDRLTAVGVVYDPDGNLTGRFDLSRYERKALEIPVRPGHQGKLYKIHTRGVVVTRIEGLEPYFSPSPEGYFVPAVREE